MIQNSQKVFIPCIVKYLIRILHHESIFRSKSHIQDIPFDKPDLDPSSG